MGFLDEVKAEQATRTPGFKDGVTRWLETLPPTERAEADAALADREVMHSALAAVIRRRGGSHVSVNMVANYRQKLRGQG